MIQVAMVEEGDEDEQFKAVMDEAKQAIQVSAKTTSPSLHQKLDLKTDF